MKRYTVTVPVELSGMARDFTIRDVQYDGPLDAEGIAKIKEAALAYIAEKGLTLSKYGEVKIYAAKETT